MFVCRGPVVMEGIDGFNASQIFFKVSDFFETGSKEYHFISISSYCVSYVR